MNPQYVGWGIGIALFLLIFGFRLSRMRGVRPFNPGLSLIFPAVLIALAASFFVYLWPYSPNNAAIAAGALAVGAVIGWWRGKLMHLATNEAGQLTIQASPLAIAFLIGLVALRMGLRVFLFAGHAPNSPYVLGLDGAFIAFAVGIFGVARLEMFLRAQKLLRQARSPAAA